MNWSKIWPLFVVLFGTCNKFTIILKISSKKNFFNQKSVTGI